MRKKTNIEAKQKGLELEINRENEPAIINPTVEIATD